MPSAKVSLNGKVIAESNDTVVVEGNHYFPPDSVNMEYCTENDRHTVCRWRGVANSFDINVDGEQFGSAAWVYPEPSHAADRIKDYVAFYSHKVQIEG